MPRPRHWRSSGTTTHCCRLVVPMQGGGAMLQPCVCSVRGIAEQQQWWRPSVTGSIFCHFNQFTCKVVVNNVILETPFAGPMHLLHGIHHILNKKTKYQHAMCIHVTITAQHVSPYFMVLWYHCTYVRQKYASLLLRLKKTFNILVVRNIQSQASLACNANVQLLTLSKIELQNEHTQTEKDCMNAIGTIGAP